MISKKQLEKWATDNEVVHFIDTDKGRLVVFNPDRFIWNAYGKDSFDSDDMITNEQWHEFANSDIFLELDDYHLSQFDEYCEDNKIGEYKK